MDNTNQPIQNSQPEPQVGHSHSSKTKLFLIGLGVLFVLGLAGAYVLGTRNSQLGQVETTVTPTVSQQKVADSTVEWKTFTKTKDGYSIQYPDSLRYVGNSGGIGPSDDWESKDRRYNISVQLFSAKDYPSSFNLPKDIIKSDETITISGQSVRKVTKEIPTGLTIDIGPIKHKNSAYFLHYFGTKGEESSGISIFNQMVSTFKFTDQAQAGDTANWKTYTNSENGYSIKYPSDKLVRLACPDEELDLVEENAGNADQDSVPLSTCGRDGRFLLELKTIKSQEPALKPDTEHYDVKSEEITVGGKMAMKYTYKQIKPFDGQGGESWFQLVTIPNVQGIYELYLGNEKYVSLRDQILSTFKFTN